VTPVEHPDAFHVYHLYVIRSPQRDQLRTFLEQNGVGTGIHYPVPIHMQPAYFGLKRGESLLATEQAAEEILSLPMYPQMTMEHVEYVAGKVREFFRGYVTSFQRFL